MPYEGIMGEPAHRATYSTLLFESKFLKLSLPRTVERHSRELVRKPPESENENFRGPIMITDPTNLSHSGPEGFGSGGSISPPVGSSRQFSHGSSMTGITNI